MHDDYYKKILLEMLCQTIFMDTGAIDLLEKTSAIL